MPDDLRARLRAFVPAPALVALATVDALRETVVCPFGDRPDSRYWNDKPTKLVPLTTVETERVAQRELEAVLRLIDAGRIAVSDKTRRPTEGPRPSSG